MNIRVSLNLLFIIMLIINFSSCVNLSKRFRSYSTEWPPSDRAATYVNVDVQTYNIEPMQTPTSNKDVFSFTEDGQAEFLKSISLKTQHSDSFLKYISKKISSQPDPPARVKVFPTKINKSIVFSVDRLWAYYDNSTRGIELKRIGDRITNLELSVDLPSTSNIEFNSWDKFVTDWVTVDLGSVSSSQEWSATATASANASSKITGSNSSTTNNSSTNKFGIAAVDQSETTNLNSTGDSNGTGSEVNTSLGPSGSLSVKDNYTTQLNLLLSRMKLSGTLGRNSIKLRQEGAFNTDLSGNTSVSVEYLFTGEYAPPIFVFKIPKLYNNDLPIIPANLKITKTMWVFPNITSPIVGQVKYKYLYRHVKSKSAKHLPEARQNVEYLYAQLGYRPNDLPPLNVELVKPEDLKPVTYRIGFGNNTSPTFYRLGSDIINFETANEAAAFLEYLTRLTAFGTITPTGSIPSDIRVIKFQN